MTPIPYQVENNVLGSKSTVVAHEDGEVEVCMEEVIRTNGVSRQPFIRRVVVRTYGGMCCERHGEREGIREVTEEEGILHASFSIPFRPLPMDKYKLGLLPEEEVKEGECFNEERGLSNNWLCWT